MRCSREAKNTVRRPTGRDQRAHFRYQAGSVCSEPEHWRSPSTDATTKSKSRPGKRTQQERRLSAARQSHRCLGELQGRIGSAHKEYPGIAITNRELRVLSIAAYTANVATKRITSIWDTEPIKSRARKRHPQLEPRERPADDDDGGSSAEQHLYPAAWRGN
jgi:hypothetical protein